MSRACGARLGYNRVLLHTQLPGSVGVVPTGYELEWSKDQKDMEAQVCPVQFNGTDPELGLDDSSMESFSAKSLPATISIGDRD